MCVAADQDGRTASRDGRHEVIDGTSEQVTEDETGTTVVPGLGTGFLSMPGAIAGAAVVALGSMAVVTRMRIVAGMHGRPLIVRRHALRRLPAETRGENGGQHEQQQQAGNEWNQRAHGDGL